MRESLWSNSTVQPVFPTLDKNAKTDFLIIGAGITGLTAAYLLSKRGHQTMVIDAGEIWSGETSRTTAHITEEMDFGYAEIESLHGLENARLVYEGQKTAFRFIEDTVKELAIDCDYKKLDAYLFPHAQNRKKILTRELEALRRIGWTDVQLCVSSPLKFFNSGSCLRFPHQAQFHPLKYLHVLAAEIVKAGGTILENTQALDIQPERVTTERGFKILAHEIIVATHSPVKNTLFFLKEAAYRSYVISAAIPKNSVEEAFFWDTSDPYHYVRIAPKNEHFDSLIVGGEDHKTGQADDGENRFHKLETWARKRFPFMGRVEYQWSGQVIEPVDGLPYIGKSPYHKNISIATGYSGQGITCGTLAGIMLADLVTGTASPWENLYNPTRKNLKSGLTFLEENSNVVKEAAKGFFKNDPVKPQNLALGQGAVIQRGLRKVAVYRNEHGEFFECSGICPHLGGTVRWNAIEKTFDCPLHGSRFTGEGKVVTGPAIKSLKNLSKKSRHPVA